jgi:galactokinase
MTEFHVPGRVEILGKHTDYAGGRSLLCAIDHGFDVSVVPRNDLDIRVHDEVRNEEFRLALHAPATPPRGSWMNYVAVVVSRMSRDFPRMATGADIRFRSNLPADAGLSSSSALVIAIALSLIDVNQLESDPSFRDAFPKRTELAGYLGAVENGRAFGAFPGDAGVGTFGGSEDHTAILCCRRGTLSQYSYAPVVHEADVELDASTVLVIASSGVVANKTGGALEFYNRLSRATSELLALWNADRDDKAPTLAAALATSRDGRRQLEALIQSRRANQFTVSELLKRLEQFAEESSVIVPAAVNALRHRDYNRFGSLVDESQRLAEEHLGNQVAETIALQRLARENGAFAASAFGGGFGGSVWALLPAGRSADFVRTWEDNYLRQFPNRADHAAFFPVLASDGAGTIGPPLH